MILQSAKKHLAVLVNAPGREHAVTAKRYDGPLHRVCPQTARDVFGLQMLEHQREKFAPAEGSGILVTPTGLEKLMK